jgi:hypothetical protein
LPGVDAKRTRANCELSYSIFSKYPAQTNTLVFRLTARLVMNAASRERSVQ